MYIINDIANTTMQKFVHLLGSQRTLIDLFPKTDISLYNVDSKNTESFKILRELLIVDTDHSPSSSNYVIDYDKKDDVNYWRTRLYNIIGGQTTNIYDELYKGSYNKKQLKNIRYEFNAPLDSIDTSVNTTFNVTSDTVRTKIETLSNNLLTLKVISQIPLSYITDIPSNELLDKVSKLTIINFMKNTDNPKLRILWLLDTIASETNSNHINVFNTTTSIVQSCTSITSTTLDGDLFDQNLYTIKFTIKKSSTISDDSINNLVDVLDMIMASKKYKVARQLIVRMFPEAGGLVSGNLVIDSSVCDSTSGELIGNGIASNSSVVCMLNSDDYDKNDDGILNGNYKSYAIDYGIVISRTVDGEVYEYFSKLDPEFAVKLFMDMLTQDIRVHTADAWARVLAVIIIIATIIITILSFGSGAPISASAAGWALSGLGILSTGLAMYEGSSGNSANAAIFGHTTSVIGYISLTSAAVQSVNKLISNEILKDGVWEGTKDYIGNMTSSQLIQSTLDVGNYVEEWYKDEELSKREKELNELSKENERYEREMAMMPTPNTIAQTQWYNDTYQYMEHMEMIDANLKFSTDMDHYTNKYF